MSIFFFLLSLKVLFLVFECEDGMLDNRNICEPKLCVDGSWKNKKITCPTEDCTDGLVFQEANESECCGKCVIPRNANIQLFVIFAILPSKYNALLCVRFYELEKKDGITTKFG